MIPQKRGPGRPRRAKSASTAVLFVQVTPEEKALYVALAAAEGRSISDVVRDELARWARRKR